MGLTLPWGDVSALKNGIEQLIAALKHFRDVLKECKEHFATDIYPSEDQAQHHPHVFETTVTLRTQNHITKQAVKLMRVVRRNHYNKQTKKWDDEELRSVIHRLHEQTNGCTTEVQEMLDELSARYVVMMRFEDDRLEEAARDRRGSSIIRSLPPGLEWLESLEVD